MSTENKPICTVPLRRAVDNPDELLEKGAFMRGVKAAFHKYFKREPYFSHGKLKWRYWYHDEKEREHGKKTHDPGDKHEHHLITDQSMVHENLKNKAIMAAEATVDAIKKLFGWKGMKEDDIVRVVQTPGWSEKHHDPYVQKEAKTGEGARSPNARVVKGTELISDELKELVSREQRHYSGLREVTLTSNAEDAYISANPGGVAAYASTSGDLVLGDGAVSTPVGEAKYGKGLTWTELCVTHEFGHHVHYALEEENPELIRKWQSLRSKGGKKISAYAGTNWKEDFAESFACAHILPKQLALECPDRYEFMREHIIPELPPMSDMLDTPDDDLAWWNERPLTPPGKILNYLHMKKPDAEEGIAEHYPHKFHPYYSERDQFYKVAKDGRVIYFRFGPPDKESEPGWDRMPATIDPETMLPRYEGDMAGFGRFRAKGNLKEIYDENGRPLSDKQAFFYLGQDDEKIIELSDDKVRTDMKIADDDPVTPEDYFAWLAKQKKTKKGFTDTHRLGERMFNTLGLTLNKTLEQERARVKKKVDKGKNPYLERHDWAPVEIPKDEYLVKSGTFKFGDVRKMPPTEKQYLHEFDKKGNKVTRTYLDPVSGKQIPVLAESTYQQENPDGTFTRLRVCEAAPFVAGQSIYAPQEVEKTNPETGEKYKAIDWIKYQIKPGDPLEPDRLANQFDTTAQQLLFMNDKFGRGQIMDPVVTALINPSRQEIRNEEDLQNLMRAAAEADPPRRTWVSVLGGGTEVGNTSIAHIQVEWDGAGPPKVVGDYWAKRLGKAECRIDELLAADNTIKLGAIKETMRTAKKKKVGGVGDHVWAIDPKAERRVVMRISKIERDKKTGKKFYMVQPLPGQGPRLSRGVVAVDTVQPMTTAEIPNKPGKVRRHVQPLQSDVLLYADEMEEGKYGFGRGEGGVIKIKPPKDGSISRDQLRRIQGVTELEPDLDQISGDLTLAITDLPRMREQLGGFAMDDGVRSMLDSAMRLEREQNLAAEKKEVIKTEELVKDDGTIDPDGLLKGMITGTKGVIPADHQIKALKKIAKGNGRLLLAHYMGMGKTLTAIMAGAMMRNLKDEMGNPHPNQIKKRILHVVPLNTAENWYQEFKKFHTELPALIGASTLAGAQQLPKLPVRGDNESKGVYKKRVMEHWQELIKDNPAIWNPWSDDSKNVIIPFEYFRDNEEALRLTGQFDGMVADEGHKTARKNQLSNAVERWQPFMKMFVSMTGTPVTNKLSTIPRMIELVSGGMRQMGTPEQFEKEWLTPSAVMRAFGMKNPPLTDINPMKIGEFAAILQPLVDVATAADVKGNAMPAVLLDENNPAHMIGQQARMYRMAIAHLTEEDREALAESAALGLDERERLSAEARRKVSHARSVANCPSYKGPDMREYVTYKHVKSVMNKRGKKVGEKEVIEEFQLPPYKDLIGTKRHQWRGKWPTDKDVEDKRLPQGYLNTLRQHFEFIMGVAYEKVEGKKIDPEMLKTLSKGAYKTATGFEWLKTGGKIPNPDYGPEGMTCRGDVEEPSGKIKPITYNWFNPVTGKLEKKEIPVGWKAIRDPNKKAAGLYYAADDWDFTGRFEDSGEEEDTTAEDEEEGEDEEKKKKKRKAKGKTQGPKPGREHLSLQRSPERREERAMFDAITTHNNAKTDKLEEWIKNSLDSKTGDVDPELGQFVLFGNRVGSSVRTMEAKMRTMGYQDVNEALGHPDTSSDADKKVRPRKYFITYMGKSATQGERNINSEIFRRKADQFGKDTGVSMFVHRTLYGTTGDPPEVGEITEGWGRKERKQIYDQFADGYGRINKRTGKPLGLEVPLRVTGVKGPKGTVEMRYVYDSDLSAGERKLFEDLEVRIRATRGKEQEKHEKAMRDLLKPHWTDKTPLTNGDHNTPDQHYVFNNTQVMVASDAAQVGLNWPAAKLGMYDSLFSPMDEWQRIARAARLLPKMVSPEMKPIVDKMDESIRKYEQELKLDPHHHTESSAMELINRAIKDLPKKERVKLNDLPGGAPDQILEGYFCKRALDKISSKHDEVGKRLREEGAVPDPTKPRTVENYIPKEAITEADIMNEIVRNHLTEFDKQMLRGRRALVEAKRFTVSCDVPMMVVRTITDPDTGQRKRVRVPARDEAGNVIFETESPVKSERSILAAQRAKQVPYEQALNIIKNALPTATNYDFVSEAAGSMGRFSFIDPNAEIDMTNPDPNVVGVAHNIARSKAEEKITKAFPIHYVKPLLWDHIAPKQQKFVITR